MDPNYNATFASVARHVPRSLRHQLICKLTSQFIDGGAENDGPSMTTRSEELTAMEPSIERFYGALLFVDISGFTALADAINRLSFMMF